jgi:hypothetical protein
VINSNMAETDRRVSMRIMAPLMRRYSQEIKTGAFGLTTTRIKEKKQVRDTGPWTVLQEFMLLVDVLSLLVLYIELPGLSERT